MSRPFLGAKTTGKAHTFCADSMTLISSRLSISRRSKSQGLRPARVEVEHIGCILGDSGLLLVLRKKTILSVSST